MSSTDLTFLEESSNGNKNFVLEMINIFLKQTPGLIKTLKEQNGDWENFRKTFHKFRPTIRMVGMQKGNMLVETIEKEYKSENPDPAEVKKHLLKLEKECDKAYQELKAYAEHIS